MHLLHDYGVAPWILLLHIDTGCLATSMVGYAVTMCAICSHTLHEFARSSWFPSKDPCYCAGSMAFGHRRFHRRRRFRPTGDAPT